MLIKIFINADTEVKAIKVYNEFIEKIGNFIEEEKNIKIEPYWKYDDMYVIETIIILTCTPNDMQFQEFLHKISDKWQFFGLPIDEALASINSDGCSYMINGINMINILY